MPLSVPPPPWGSIILLLASEVAVNSVMAWRSLDEELVLAALYVHVLVYQMCGLLSKLSSVAPPLKNVRKKRFRKTATKKVTFIPLIGAGKGRRIMCMCVLTFYTYIQTFIDLILV